MSNVTIEINGSKLRAITPYNAMFVDLAHRLNAKWNKPAWVFDARDEHRVRKCCMELFGEDGVSVSEKVTLRIEWPGGGCSSRDGIYILGRVIAMASGRDSGARVGEGIVTLKGGFGSGGSVKNWETRVDYGTIVLVRDMPKDAVDALIAEGHRSRVYSIEPEAPVVDAAALRAERDRLLVRIAEIDALLK